MFFIANKLMSSDKNEFLPNRNCITNLIERLDIITDSLDKGLSVDLIYKESSKAFDKVSHSKLLVKLEAYGISDLLLEWINYF